MYTLFPCLLLKLHIALNSFCMSSGVGLVGFLSFGLGALVALKLADEHYQPLLYSGRLVFKPRERDERRTILISVHRSISSLLSYSTCISLFSSFSSFSSGYHFRCIVIFLGHSLHLRLVLHGVCVCLHFAFVLPTRLFFLFEPLPPLASAV